MSSTASAPRSSSSPLLWLVAAGFFMQTLDTTIVNTALPAMARSLGESPLRMQSVVVAYSLTMAMLIPASGWISDRFGTRRVFFTAILVFALGSLCCALSRNLAELVGARILQGMGGALLLPVGRAAVLRGVPRSQFLQAMSFVAVPGLIGPLLGPTLGGWLVQYTSWHWIFLINLPVGLIGCAATLVYMPDGRAAQPGRFDLVGYGWLAFGMVAVSLALDGLAELGLPQVTVVLLVVFGLASLAAYWLHALRRPDPLFSPAMFSVQSLRVGLIGNLFARVGNSAMPYLVPLLLQVGLDFTPLHAGMMLLPAAAAGMAAKPVAARLIARFGYRQVLVGNTMLVGLTIVSYALIGPEQPLWVRLLQFAVFGAVNSMQFTAMNTVTLKDMAGPLASSGSSLLSMVQMLAMGMGVACAGAVLAGFNTYFGAAGLASGHSLRAFHATFVTMGLITMASAWIFWQLEPDTAATTEEVKAVDADTVDHA
ncbi:DHA2 family efflux MFS transporter permease subunit [Xylophilus rhododendri]|uniref:DHA2 family efflux MFS transporter permease subunit n=1 Tax=Xylophilus rhododendri TaxID=2697032 RepID=A0A857J6I5_9BURK|nr:multidrug transporter subunit MdtD [Xylophilus rhododendri]QHI99610.1 DHA2 family efflux MFS transporter permease subunit [Xylophilus rhododendri]